MPHCQTPISNRDNVPVVGWLLLRGRCRSCRARVSVLYPVLEAETAGCLVVPFLVYDDVWVAVGVAGLLALMPAIAVIDIQHRIIPNTLIYPSLIAFPVYLVVGRLAGADLDLAGMVAGFLAFGGGLLVIALISKGMGMGDVKLAALIGLVLGAVELGFVGAAAGSAIVLGGLGGVVALIVLRDRKAAIPFGPYLAAGAVIAACFGRQLVDWYQRAVIG